MGGMEPNVSATNSPLAPGLAGRLFNKAEVAQFLGVTPRTIENLTRRGLPHYKLGSRRNCFD